MDKKQELTPLEIFPWNENFATGIEEIDIQHKKLIELLNNLANTLTQEKIVEVEETFNKLAEYADFHFKSEEEVWKKYLKDDVLVHEHKDSHESFLPKILELQKKNSDKTYYEIVEDVLLFLIRWLAFHIIDEDRRLALIIHAIKDGCQFNEAKFLADKEMGGSMRSLIDAILSMYDNLSLKAINLIRERKARLKAQKELRDINKKLERLSITDQLTSLYNRRHFDDTFNLELKKAVRNKTSLSLIIFDIDFFKKLNDTYGHAKGDEALIRVSRCLLNTCKRPNDYCFRIGGEEFAVIISNEDEKSAIGLCKLLQKNVNALNIPNKDSKLGYLTISMGLASLYPTVDDTVDSITKLADDRLYFAKKKGRDTIVY